MDPAWPSVTNLHGPGLQDDYKGVTLCAVNAGGNRQREGGDCGEAAGGPALPPLEVPAIHQTHVSLPPPRKSYSFCVIQM